MITFVNKSVQFFCGVCVCFMAFAPSAFSAEFGRYNIVNIYAFPPEGTSLGEIQAFIYEPDQNKYVPVEVQLSGGNFGVYFYGTFNCLQEEKGKLVDKTCAFMQRFPFDLKNRKALSPLEHEIGRVLSSINRIEFSPWSRYALSYEECGKVDYFRISLQYGVSEADRLISITVPYSDKEEIQFKDMELKSQEPCLGKDIFFTPDSLFEFLKKSYQYKAPLIEMKP